MTHLCMDAVHLAKWVADRGRRVGGHRSDERTFISVGSLVRVCAAPANIHDVEARLHSAAKEDGLKVTTTKRGESLLFSLQSKSRLTGCCEESQAGVASSQRGGWELLRGRSSPPHQSTTSSSAGPQTPSGQPSLPASHYLPDSSPSSPGRHFARHCDMHTFLMTGYFFGNLSEKKH